MDRFPHRAEVEPAHRVGTRAADIIEGAVAAGRPLVLVHGAAVATAEILLELEQRGAEPLLPGGPVEFVHAGGGMQEIEAAAARVTSHAEGAPVLLVVHPLGHDNAAGRSQLDCSFAHATPFVDESSVCLFGGAEAAAGSLPVLLRHSAVQTDGIRVSTESPEGRLLLFDLLIEHLDSGLAVRRLAMSPSITGLDRPAVERFIGRRLLALNRQLPGAAIGGSPDGECSATCSICEAVAATDGDVADLLEAARPHIGATLLLEDANFQPVAWSPDDQPPPSLTVLITPGRLSRLTAKLVPGVPALVRLGTPASGQRWVVRIGATTHLGVLSATPGSAKSPAVTSWLRHIYAPLASELTRQAGRRRLRGEARRALVTVLVRGELSRESARIAINDLVGPLGVRVAAMSPAAGSGTPTSMTPVPSLSEPGSLARRLDSLGLSHGEYDGLAVALFDGSSEGPTGLLTALRPHRMTIGLGSTVTDPDEISSSARQAAWTCRMAVATRRPMLDFAEIGVHRLLVPGAEAGDPEFEEPIHRVELAQSGLGFDTVGTLVGYLDSGGNYRQAARDLTIHVNTLRYRLKRIADIIEADLDDPEQRFRLLLAARLRAGRRALAESRTD